MNGLYIGLMSGTSADGVDAILLEISLAPTPAFRILATADHSYSSAFREQLLQLALEPSCDKARLGTLSAQLADHFTDAVQDLLQQTGLEPEQISGIGSHGHTIDHAPDNPLPYTLQITDHARLTEKTGIRVICDFRSRDVAAGGQGAPLVPAFHHWLLSCNGRSTAQGLAVVNIGGISNLTLPEQQLGYDCGPGNCLIDAWHQMHTGEPYDHDGASARRGKLIPELLDALSADAYFQRPPPKSTGREYFNQQWLQPFLQEHHNLWHDVAYTLTALTGRVIGDQLSRYHCHTAFLCGGGSHNSLLREQIQHSAPEGLKLVTTEDLGIAPDWIEAAAFAWLACQTLNGLPGNLPAATGACGPRILGAIYPV